MLQRSATLGLALVTSVLLGLPRQGRQDGPALTLDLGGGVTLACRRIEPGRFTMGAPPSDTLAHDAERPAHEVVIDRAFCLGSTPVTVGQFRRFVEATGYRTDAEADGRGGHGFDAARNRFAGWFPQYTWRNSGWVKTDAHPVANVSRNDAVAFTDWLSRVTGRTVRLPSEAEWEYACRAGTTTGFFTGDDPPGLAGYANVADAALGRVLGERKPFPFDDGHAFTSPVGTYKPNPWGLYDMIGNVFEWTVGDFTGSYAAPSAGTTTVPVPGRDGVVRGGGYDSGPEFARCTVRGRSRPSGRYSYFGFRVVVSL
jgi:formylglycine-generating enzyme